jgi:hypothetical protein
VPPASRRSLARRQPSQKTRAKHSLLVRQLPTPTDATRLPCVACSPSHQANQAASVDAIALKRREHHPGAITRPAQGMTGGPMPPSGPEVPRPRPKLPATVGEDQRWRCLAVVARFSPPRHPERGDTVVRFFVIRVRYVWICTYAS